LKLAIMQPYFFPYIGYFSLLDYADEFIIFDTVQYDRKGWMKRNRILKPNGGWQYFQAGVIKPEYKAIIKDVLIEQDDGWKAKIYRQLHHYKMIAPFYAETMRIVERCLNWVCVSLTDLNRNILSIFCDYLNIKCPLKTFSKMDLEILTPVEHAGQWALRIAQVYGAAEYVNPPGGKEIFNPKDFQENNIKLSFLSNNLKPYDQKRAIFEPALSIIDIMMFCEKEKVIEMLKDYNIESL
jgi:hypothetical protein